MRHGKVLVIELGKNSCSDLAQISADWPADKIWDYDFLKNNDRIVFKDGVDEDTNNMGVPKWARATSFGMLIHCKDEASAKEVIANDMFKNFKLW